MAQEIRSLFLDFSRLNSGQESEGTEGVGVGRVNQPNPHRIKF